MSIAKYSPTVFFAYRNDKNWFKKNGGGFNNGNTKNSDLDNDGFDQYGYDTNGKDREEYTEDDYLNNSAELNYPHLLKEVEMNWLNKKIIK